MRARTRNISRPVAVLVALSVTLVVTAAGQVVLDDRADATPTPSGTPGQVVPPTGRPT